MIMATICEVKDIQSIKLVSTVGGQSLRDAFCSRQPLGYTFSAVLVSLFLD